MCKSYVGLAAIVALALTTWTPVTNAANILALLPSPSPSHLIVEMAVVRALVERGHNVTVVSSLPIKPTELHRKLNFIILNSGHMKFQESVKAITNTKGLKRILTLIQSVHKLSTGVAEILDDPIFQDFLNNKDNKFDLFLHGYIFSEYLFGVAAHFNCPTVLIWPNQLIPHVMGLIGNSYETAYVPLPFVFSEGVDKLSDFTFRLKNILRTSFDLTMGFLLDRSMKEIYDKHFPADRYPDYATVKKNVSLVLYCHHFTEKPVRALVPGLVEIGGIQLDEQPNELPLDIANFLDEADEKHGVIFFSLGTNVRADYLPPNTFRTIYNVLSKLPQRVIWKCDSLDDLPDNSPNILKRLWVPQPDILAHRNVRLFFTHGGKGGITEAQFYGVPMVVMPVFGDQPSNSKEVVSKGYGVEISKLEDMTEDDVRKAIDEVLTNPNYRQRVQQFSKLYRDRPMTAKQTAVYWVEYVIRNRGAFHMESPLKHLNFVEKHNLDVLLFMFAIIFAIIQGIKLSFKFLKNFFRKILRRKPEKKVKTN